MVGEDGASTKQNILVDGKMRTWVVIVSVEKRTEGVKRKHHSALNLTFLRGTIDMRDLDDFYRAISRALEVKK
jgi:hypothetical protein